MKLLDYANAMNVEIILTYVPNSVPGWVATVNHMKEIDGGTVSPYKGCGATPALALKALAKTMSKTNARIDIGDMPYIERYIPELEYYNLDEDCR